MTDDPASFPPSEESLRRLWRSGWCCGETAFHLETGGIVWVVDGRNGENQLRVDGSSSREAWYRAVEAAAERGMLDGWRDPTWEAN